MAHNEDLRELEGRIIELEARLRQPIPMHLFCPICHVQHFDPPGFRPHRTHTCQNCGHHWQPALVETVGVKFLPGCGPNADDPPVSLPDNASAADDGMILPVIMMNDGTDRPKYIGTDSPKTPSALAPLLELKMRACLSAATYGKKDPAGYDAYVSRPPKESPAWSETFEAVCDLRAEVEEAHVDFGAARRGLGLKDDEPLIETCEKIGESWRQPPPPAQRAGIVAYLRRIGAHTAATAIDNGEDLKP